MKDECRSVIETGAGVRVTVELVCDLKSLHQVHVASEQYARTLTAVVGVLHRNDPEQGERVLKALLERMAEVSDRNEATIVIRGEMRA